MTREHAKKMLPIITAFANGERVQYRTGGCWREFDEYNFQDPETKYRIAPKSEDAEWLRNEANRYADAWELEASRIRAIADKLELLEGGAE